MNAPHTQQEASAARAPESARSPAEPPPPGRRKPVSGARRVARMARFEMGLVFRQRIAILMSLAAPALALGFPLLLQPSTDEEWQALLPAMCVLVLLMSTYITTATTVTSRRENQLFKRLRTSELSPAQMLTALLLPLVLVGVAQIAAIVVGYWLLGAPAPTDLGLLALGVGSTALLAVVAGAATAMFALTSERVQFVAVPLMLTGAIATNAVLNPQVGDYQAFVLVAPFAANADLVARGLGAPEAMLPDPALQVPAVMVSLGLIAVWMLIFALTAKARWRWEPRG